MDSSSEGSFAWTDASTDSTDNENMAITSQNVNQSGEESESGKTYKKKLQKRLFSGSGADELSSEPAQDGRVRKRQLSSHHEDVDNSPNPKNNRIKVEPESDADIPKKKKKKASDSINDLNDESFLNSKVKSEQKFVVPSPVKVKNNKKKSVSGANDTFMSNGDVEPLEVQSLSNSKGASITCVSFENSSTPDSSQAEEENKYKVIKDKKKNKKSNKKLDDSELDGALDDRAQAGETTNTERYMSTSAEVMADNCASTPNHVSHDKTKTNKKSLKSAQDTVLKTDNVQNHTSELNNSESLFTNRKSRMSERIQFEEDDSDVQIKSKKSKSTEIPKKKSESKKILSFLDASPDLTRYHTKLPSALVLTDDDDVWLIRCPKDVKLDSFQDKNWILDSKCKIKLDGQTYEGDVGDAKSNITVLSSENDRPVIKNVTINGCIRLRRRLPKAHIQENNVMINNQTNFIPLPDTKCRHPLFGLNYKKAMKIPSGVAERLRATRGDLPAATRNKKKREQKYDDIQLESAATFNTEHTDGKSSASEEITQSMIISKKKKKNKRKRSDAADDQSAPRLKKSKRDLESSEVWESEKAIEENLFNF